ncbi:hypothetical protein [Bradyrhizobium sp. BWC-3-1]|uniref:hypothetical protein n=1 Tax=Bradyrhizobium sp. BWC-3-1 TaxID=3080012 RepID=UPI00293E4758|nr:hypothetical protein [Bradyrhizobium sp. BWC-3-1]WOH61946.1 hypothetical protein RX329_18365 [Bradyrhizobium sp. BWC-3-1]
MLHTRKQMTEETAAAMAARNARRIEIVKRALGDKYAHHPGNHVQRIAKHDWSVNKVISAERIKFDFSFL